MFGIAGLVYAVPGIGVIAYPTIPLTVARGCHAGDKPPVGATRCVIPVVTGVTEEGGSCGKNNGAFAPLR